jgi:hypothetical protein
MAVGKHEVRNLRKLNLPRDDTLSQKIWEAERQIGDVTRA